jgi:hypothetical protein
LKQYFYHAVPRTQCPEKKATTAATAFFIKALDSNFQPDISYAMSGDTIPAGKNSLTEALMNIDNSQTTHTGKLLNNCESSISRFITIQDVI